MKLVSISLENIKSYVRETINFYEGVNFISGANGAGKSTLIEAIGYTLFDANPFSSLKQLIKEGEKKGEISVVFEAQDERLYRIVRKLRIPSGGSWTVYDLESGGELNELHSNQDVREWLVENLGITTGLDPALLFEDIIGVSQGRFTTPFLEKGERRKKLFNTILQLESYRETFDKTASLNTALGEGIAIKERHREGLLVRIEDLLYCREQLQEKEKQQAALQKVLLILRKELMKLEEEIKLQERYKLDVEKGNLELERLKVRLKGLAEQKERLEKDLEIAEQCQEKVEAAAPGYAEFIQLQKEREELEKQRKMREILNQKSQKLQNELAALKAEVNSAKENRGKLLLEGEAELNNLQAEGEKISQEKKKAEENKVQGEKARELLEEKKKAWQVLVGIRQQGREFLTDRQYLESDLHLLAEEKAVCKAALVKWDEVEKHALSVPSLENDQNLLREKLNLLKAKLDSLRENSLATRDGLCPFLQMPCNNVGGDLQQYFQQEIVQLRPQIEAFQCEDEDLTRKLAEARKAVVEWGLLQNTKKQLEALSLREKETLEKVGHKEKEMLENFYPDFLEQLLIFLQEGREFLEKMGTFSDTGTQFALRLQTVQDELLKYKAVFRRISDSNSSDNGNCSDTVSLLLNILDIIETESNFLWENLEGQLHQYLEAWSKKTAGLESMLNYQRERYRKVRDDLKSIREDTKLEAKEQELISQTLKLSQLEKELHSYSNLEEQWGKNAALLKGAEPFYLQYVQNKEGAEKKEKLVQELRGIISEENEKNAEKERLEKFLAESKEKYQVEVLTDMRVQWEQLLTEKVHQEKDLSYCLQELTKYRGLIEEKEQIQQKICKLDQEISREQKGRQLLQLVRTVLKDSGEEMAQVYRQYLGREADAIYQQVSGEHVNLVWADDYEVKIIDSQEGQSRERIFSQLSGGEKMTAALAVRLALLQQFSGFGVGIFDEPTSNLDEQRRNNLARIIPSITGNLRQIFVISHDDTFDAITENVIMLRKDNMQGTRVVLDR